MSRRITTVAAALAVLATAATPLAAVFHNRLVRAEPGIDSVVTTPPTSVRLWFAQEPERKATSIRVLTADSTPVPTGDVQPTDDPKSVAAPIEGPLGAGSYIVRWRTAGSDGHIIRGSYTFTVRP